MQNAYVVTGFLTNAQTVVLDEALPLRMRRVRLIVESMTRTPLRPYPEVIAEIRLRQQVRRHQPSNQIEVDSYVHGERDSWEL